MTAQARNQSEVKAIQPLWKMCEDFVVKFALRFWSNSSDCMARLGTNMTEYAPEIELYNILATLGTLNAGIGHI